MKSQSRCARAGLAIAFGIGSLVFSSQAASAEVPRSPIGCALSSPTTGFFAGSTDEAIAAASGVPGPPRGGVVDHWDGPVRPIVTVQRTGSTPYNGFIPLKLTVDGLPINATIELAASVVTPTRSFVDTTVIEVRNGVAYYGYCLGESTLGSDVRITFSVVDDDTFLPSSASPRIYRMTDLPTPSMTFEPGPFVAATGEFVVGVKVSDFPFVNHLPVHMIIRSGDGRVTLAEKFSGVTNGVSTIPYRLDAAAGSALSISTAIYASDFVKGAGAPVRKTAISAGRVLAYSLPSGTTMKRKGLLVVATSEMLPGDQKFYLNVVADGRSFVFPGKFEYGRSGVSGPGVHFDYALPEAMVGKSARMTISNPMSAQFLAGSSSARTYTLVK
ncbi:MAG: hypothetical protein KDB26_06455 [Microthrixaceae bacterium]|nr:hypothetical protein [Microthrixaceae bacterium]